MSRPRTSAAELRRRLDEIGWDDLLAQTGNHDPFQRAGVLALHAERAREVRVVTARRGGGVVAAAVLQPEWVRGIRVMRTVGTSAAWFDVRPPAIDDDAARRLAVELSRLPCDILTLPEVPPDMPLERELRARGRAPRRRHAAPTFRVDSTDIARLGRRRRAVASRLRKAARDGVPIEVVVHDDWASMAAAYTASDALYRGRWQQGADELVWSPWGRRFVAAAMEGFGRAGQVRLVTGHQDDRLVAFALAVVDVPGAVVFRTAYDRDRVATLGGGAIALMALLDRLHGEGLTTFDLAAGGDEFKSRFTAPTPLVTLQWPVSRRGALYLRLSGIRARVGRSTTQAA